MKILQKTGSFIRGLVAGAAVLAYVSTVQAHPYASQITNSGTTISFILNENATDVSIIYGAHAATNDLGAGTKGVMSFPLTYLGTNYTTYSISVFNVGNGQLTEISSDANTLNSIANANAVAVNNNPANANFGRTYVGKRLGAGFIVRNADQSDTLGQGSTALFGGLNSYNGTNLLNPGGSSFDACRMYVGPKDDQVYVGSATTVANGFWLAAMDPNLASFQFVLAGTDPTLPAGQNHGGPLGTPIVTGSIATGDLVVYCMDWDYPPGQCLQQWNIGAGPLPSSVLPTMLANSTETQVQNWADAFFFGTNYYTFLDRSSHTSPGFGGSLSVFHAATGTAPVWQSFVNTTVPGFDLFANCAAIQIAPNGQYLVGIDNATEMLIFCSLDADGIPILSTLFTNVVGTATAGTYGSIAFDAAQNIYEATQANGLLKVFSPGLTTLAVTANDTTATNGTFSLTFTTPSVTATASIPSATQNTSPNGTGAGPATPGQITITRTGSTALPLTVNFFLEGTATNAVYTATAGASTFQSTNGAGAFVNNSITIAAGQTSTNITITPSTANVSRPSTTVTLVILPNANYSVPIGATPTVTIINTSSQSVSINGVGAPSMYRAYSNDFASFIVTRFGDINAPSFTVSTWTGSGTAIAGTDYTLPTNITFNPGDVSYTNIIQPLRAGAPTVDTANPTYVGNLTAVIGVSAGTGYAATANTATLTSIDNANPPATVLFSDPLDSSTATADSNTWLVTFGNKDSTYPTNGNYEVNFGYDMTTDPDGFHGTVAAAPNGATRALRLTVNKAGTTGNAGATAGVNVYPVDPTAHTALVFSNSYAVRFNMALVKGANAGFATEGALFGIDHSGADTNWFTADGLAATSATPWPSDGYWMWVDADAGGTTDGDFIGFQGLNPAADTGWGFIPGGAFGALFDTGFTKAFKNNPGPFLTTVGGSPAAESANVTSAPATPWVDVEIKQINNGTLASPTNIITFSINKTTILAYTSTNVYKSGDLMLGYNDPFASIGQEDSAAFFSNLRVVQIGRPVITQTATNGGNVVINFTTSDGEDTSSSFTLLSSGAALTPVNVDTVVPGATFTQLGSGAFQVTTARPTNSAQFYRLRHN